MIAQALFTSKTPEWATPQSLFDELDAEFDFTLDVAASPANNKCSRYFSVHDDGLKQEWRGRVWCNPPYGRSVGEWVKKASEEIQQSYCELVVMLMPARTCTRWFHDYMYKQGGVELRFIRGRLKFNDGKTPAPFPSLIAVFRKSI